MDENRCGFEAGSEPRAEGAKRPEASRPPAADASGSGRMDSYCTGPAPVCGSRRISPNAASYCWTLVIRRFISALACCGLR